MLLQSLALKTPLAKKPWHQFGMVNNLGLAQTLSLKSHFYLVLIKCLCYPRPSCLSELDSSQICLVPLPANLGLCTGAGDRRRGCKALRQGFPFGLPAQVRPWRWWVKLKQTLAQSKLLVLICGGKNLCNVCQGNAIFLKVVYRALLYESDCFMVPWLGC